MEAGHMEAKFFTVSGECENGNTWTHSKVFYGCTAGASCKGGVQFGAGCEPSFWDDMDEDLGALLEGGE